MYPWLLVCRINGSLIVWNSIHHEILFAGIDTGTWLGHMSEQAMVWKTMHHHAQLFATMDTLPHNERQKVQVLVNWSAEGDRITTSLRPFIYNSHSTSAPVLPFNCSLTILDFLNLRPNT